MNIFMHISSYWLNGIGSNLLIDTKQRQVKNNNQSVMHEFLSVKRRKKYWHACRRIITIACSNLFLIPLSIDVQPSVICFSTWIKKQIIIIVLK
jgi:hypothetical protein